METLQPVLVSLQQSHSKTTMIPGAGSAMASKFAALRQKLEGRMSNKTKSSRKRRRDDPFEQSSKSTSLTEQSLKSTTKTTTTTNIPIIHLPPGATTAHGLLPTMDDGTCSIVVVDYTQLKKRRKKKKKRKGNGGGSSGGSSGGGSGGSSGGEACRHL